MKSNMEPKPCPFCGGSFEIVCVDENDNMYEAGYLEDYPEVAMKYDWRFGVVHQTLFNPTCPIATVKRKLLGGYEYDSEETAIIAINMRATK